MDTAIIGADAAKLAGLQVDQLQKVRKGQITLEHIEWFNDLSRAERDKLSDLESVKAFNEHRNPFPPTRALDIPAILTTHQAFYHKFFNMDMDFSQVPIPERRVDFDRLIIVAQGMTPNKVFGVCAKHFPCWRYSDDLDTAVPKNDREPKDHYAIWVRDRTEADEEHKNKSANKLKKENTSGITLLERLLLELKFWSETERHMDIDNITLCSGSRDSDGGVPDADWYRDRFEVNWCHPGDSDSHLRSREAVS